jgi:3-deoxy-D-manno-octulosonic-acid transferase
VRPVYLALGALLLPFALLRVWWRGRLNPEYRRHWKERLGVYSEKRTQGAPVWVHAVSVGEVAAAAPVVRALRERDQHVAVLISTTTPTGKETVERLFGQNVLHVYCPYDLPFAVNAFLRQFRPRALLLMETELWPMMVEKCSLQGIPVFLLNGRLSARSAARYTWVRPLLETLLARLNCAAMQTADDAARLCGLGASPARVVVTGSLKFDLQVPASVFEEAAATRRGLGVDRQVLMAGSTRPGEEAILLETFAMLRQSHPYLLLVLAPRHPERVAEVQALCRHAGFSSRRRSEGAPGGADEDILLLDTLGELLRFYAASDVAFVGGSLVPLGGQNVLEPAAVGIPVVTGPHLFNFLEISHKLAAGGALKIAMSQAELTAVVDAWLVDPEARDEAGRRGRAIVEENRGATDKVMTMLKSYGA